MGVGIVCGVAELEGSRVGDASVVAIVVGCCVSPALVAVDSCGSPGCVALEVEGLVQEIMSKNSKNKMFVLRVIY